MHKVDINRYPHHMRRDYAIRNDNIDKGVELCPRCGGTSNELVSMYKQCIACQGTGIKNPNFDYSKE